MSRSLGHESYPFELTVGTVKFTQAEPNGFEYIEIEDHVDMIGVADLAVNMENQNWGTFQVGDEVECMVGETERKMFAGVVTGMRYAAKGGKQLLILRAMDPLCKAAASRRTKVYEELKDSDIVQEVLGLAGLEPGQIDATDEAHPYVFQRSESDLEFMKRLAARNNYLLRSAEGKVDFVKPQFGGSGYEVKDEALTSLDYSYSVMSVPPEITTYGWDYNTSKMVEGTATDSDIEAIGSGESALSLSGRIWSGGTTISDVDVSAQGGAKGIAMAELNRAARNFLRGRATIDGDANIFAGAVVKFSGHREGFNPEAYVISARHRIVFKRGFETQFNFCSNTLPV